MAEKIEHRFPGRGAAEIYDRLVAELDQVAGSYGLRLDTDPTKRSGRVHKRGMVDVSFAVGDERLSADLDFGMLLPRPIREKVRAELEKRLGSLFA